MIAFAITGFFAIVALIVGLVLLDSGLKFYSAAKTLYRMDQRNSASHVGAAGRARVPQAIIPQPRVSVTRPVLRDGARAARPVAA